MIRCAPQILVHRGAVLGWAMGGKRTGALLGPTIGGRAMGAGLSLVVVFGLFCVPQLITGMAALAVRSGAVQP
jgi:AAHS family 4-hydroxybenzoate transporter-like MFS transporter